MSGDIRAKKNTKMLNKTGGNKREKNKSASHLQTSDSQSPQSCSSQQCCSKLELDAAGYRKPPPSFC